VSQSPNWLRRRWRLAAGEAAQRDPLSPGFTRFGSPEQEIELTPERDIQPEPTPTPAPRRPSDPDRKQQHSAAPPGWF